MQLERFIETNSESHLAFGERKLVALVESLGLNERRGAYLRLFARLAGSLASLPLRSSPAWPSDVSDDGTPFEFSVAFSGARAQLRILAEPQTAPFTVRSNFEAGCALTSALGTLDGVDLEHLHRILPLFAPTASSSGRFAIWHAGTVEADGRESFKVYLNPGLDGREYSAPRSQAALRALNAGYAWKSLPAASGKPPDLCYFSLDLSPAPDARIKLYVAHPGATSETIEALLHPYGAFAPGFVREAIETLTGSAGPFCERPLLTCHAFRGPEQPPDVTVHVPVRCYVADDAEALVRASRLLDPESQATLEAATAAVAQRPLGSGRGLVSYVSFRQEGGSLRVTTYLATEAFSVSTRRPKEPRDSVMVPRGPSAGTLERAEFGTVLDSIEYERARLARHPFLARLEGAGEPAHAAALARTLVFFVMCFQDVPTMSTMFVA